MNAVQSTSDVRISGLPIDLMMEAGYDAGGWMEKWGSDVVTLEGVNLVSVNTKVLSEGACTWG